MFTIEKINIYNALMLFLLPIASKKIYSLFLNCIIFKILYQCLYKIKKGKKKKKKILNFYLVEDLNFML